LDNLSAEAFQALRPSLQLSELKAGRTLHAPRDQIRDVYFPINSIVSVVSEMSDGKTSEVGIIGREGTTGLPIALGQSSANHRHIVQVGDSALQLPAKDLRAAFQQQPELHAQLLRYAQATLASASQTGACNRLHPVNERCARWLLMAHDRVEGDLVLLTQDFLSQMLGVRRAGVTVAASTLQEAGLIEYSRGRITVRNRRKLESAACECYGVLERDWKGIMGYSPSKTRRDASRAARRV
jgi:CRP-like cAMP-binding protein